MEGILKIIWVQPPAMGMDVLEVWPSFRREMVCSRVNLVSVIHRHLLSSEAGFVALVPDSGGDHSLLGNRAACFFLSKIN